MAPPTPTILALKQNFLTTQTRLLSQPVQPSRTWRRGNDAAADKKNGHDENDQKLSEKALDDALYRLNHTLQQHARRVYAPQATRHVAEQIDRLYLSVGDNRDESENGEGEDSWRIAGADYANSTVIASLPPTWDSERDATAHPLEAKRYAELVEQIQGDLCPLRDEVEARVRRLQRIQALLAPFSTTTTAKLDNSSSNNNNNNDKDNDGENNASVQEIQKNLVTRDGEVEKELERMRMLLARVGDKVARLREREGDADADDDLFGDGEAMIVDDVEVEEARKINGLLDGMG